MPLTSEQKEILRLLLANRTPQSYLAGGAALNRKENSPRYSRDLDIFHETQAEVAYAADKDREILERTGYKFEWLLQQPGFFSGHRRRTGHKRSTQNGMGSRIKLPIFPAD